VTNIAQFCLSGKFYITTVTAGYGTVFNRFSSHIHTKRKLNTYSSFTSVLKASNTHTR